MRLTHQRKKLKLIYNKHSAHFIHRIILLKLRNTAIFCKYSTLTATVIVTIAAHLNFKSLKTPTRKRSGYDVKWQCCTKTIENFMSQMGVAKGCSRKSRDILRVSLDFHYLIISISNFVISVKRRLAHFLIAPSRGWISPPLITAKMTRTSREIVVVKLRGWVTSEIPQLLLDYLHETLFSPAARSAESQDHRKASTRQNEW